MATTPEGLSFKGCRDSPSPVRVGSVQRASKSRRYHHRVVLESPLERHLLEGHLEHLWEETGTEFRFNFSSADSDDMEFLRGARQRDAGTGTLQESSVVRQVTPLFTPGCSITGERNYQITVSYSDSVSACTSSTPRSMFSASLCHLYRGFTTFIFVLIPLCQRWA